MQIGVLKETRRNENRVAGTPDSIKKLMKYPAIEFRIEKSAGQNAGFIDSDYPVEVSSNRSAALRADVVLSVHLPSMEDISLMKKGALLICFVEPPVEEQTLKALASHEISCLGVELIPRISRAQSMDALSSQANIVGYRATLDAATHYGRFFPMMMTSAGMAKPARVLILGAGVAGLQAIATARRLGAKVEAFDVRSEVREQIESLGAKFFEIPLSEEGSGAGGYAKTLSEQAQNQMRNAIAEKLKSVDIAISTASIPGKQAPLLITDYAVKNMRTGSVIVDLAAATGGNCQLTQKDQVISIQGVTIIGTTNFPSLIPTDSSNFYAQNLVNLLGLILETKDQKTEMKLNLEDEIIDKALMVHGGQTRTGAANV